MFGCARASSARTRRPESAGVLGGLALPAALFAFAAALSQGAFGTGTRPEPQQPRVVALPAARLDGTVSLEEALSGRRSERDFAPAGISLAKIAQLLWAAQGITASEGRRTAPSAGALYPLQVYVVASRVETLPPGTYRYDALSHRLIRLSAGHKTAMLARAALNQDWIAQAAAILVVAAIEQRTTRKYGDRGVRYVFMEAGHAAQNILLQSVALGLGATVVGAFDDEGVRSVLGLARSERPLCLVPVGRPR